MLLLNYSHKIKTNDEKATLLTMILNIEKEMKDNMNMMLSDKAMKIIIVTHLIFRTCT